MHRLGDEVYSLLADAVLRADVGRIAAHKDRLAVRSGTSSSSPYKDRKRGDIDRITKNAKDGTVF